MKWNRADRIAIASLVLTAIGLVAAWAVVPEFRKWLRLDKADGTEQFQKPIIAGTVVDGSNNQGIGQATISVVGRSETYVTEDDGNFRFELKGLVPADSTVRIHVLKSGFASYDATTTVPTETLVIQLRRM